MRRPAHSYSPWVSEPLTTWQTTWTGCESGANPTGGSICVTGVICRHSRFRMASVTNGAANTYLLGEKYMCPDYYENGLSGDNDQCWSCGYNYDVNRWRPRTPTVHPCRTCPATTGVLTSNLAARTPWGFTWRFATARSISSTTRSIKNPLSARQSTRRPAHRREEVLIFHPADRVARSEPLAKGVAFGAAPRPSLRLRACHPIRMGVPPHVILERSEESWLNCDGG